MTVKLLILLRLSIGCLSSVPRLLEHPADVVVARDEPATLRCEAAGEPEPEVRWVKDGVEVRTAPADPASHRVLLPSGALFFLRAVQSKAEDDRGTYWCVASNGDGEVVSRKAQLDIATLKTSFSSEPLDTWVTAGEEVELPCGPPPGHPEPEVEWRRNGDKIVTSERLVVLPGGLLISSAQQADEGRYQCIARNIAGVRRSTQALLSVYVPPFVIKAPDNATVDRGQDAVFSCVMGGDPSPQIKWTREGGAVSYISASEEDAAVLRIKNVSEAEAGRYVCQAENIAGEASVSATLGIQVPPVFSIRPMDKLVKLGESVVLQCRVEPMGAEVRLFWQRQGLPVTLGPGAKHRHMTVDRNGNLRLEAVTAEDEGFFGCFAVSRTGSSSAVAKITLKSNLNQTPPIIQLGPVNQTVSEGGSVTLHCQFKARSGDKARVSWLKEGIPIEFADNDRYYLTEGYNLRIKDSKQRDTGLYTCLIKTASGQTSASASVTVVRLGAAVSGPDTVTDLLAFPASPSKPRRQASSALSSVTMVWGKPHRVGASPLRGYQVEYTRPGSGHWVTAQAQEESFTLATTEDTRALIFLVRARNEHGLSPPSPLSDTIYTEAATPPATGKIKKKSELLKQISDKLVELEEVAVLGSKKVRLSWKVLNKSGSIQSYLIQLAKSGVENEYDEKTITVSGGGTRSHVLTDLDPGSEYAVFLVVRSSMSVLSRPSSLRLFKTKEDAPDIAPSNVALKLVNSSSALVTWARPRLEYITGFKVEICINSALVTNFTLEPGSVSLILNNITTDVIYSVRLAAFNRAGMGPFSERVSLIVPPPPHQRPPDSELPVPSVQAVLTQTWFVSIVGILAIFLIVTAVGFVYVKRRFASDKHFDHYDVPVCKTSDDRSSVNYLESDTVWINSKKSASGHDDSMLHNLTYPDQSSHLYINKICPPEYSELEAGGRPHYTRNINHCTPSHQGQYYASTNIMDKVHSFNPVTSVTGAGSDLSSGSDTGLSQERRLGPGDTSSCSSSRHSETYKLSGGSRSDSGSAISGARPHHPSSSEPDHLHQHISGRLTDPGLPPPVPPMRGPSSYSAGVRALNSFGVSGYGSDNIYSGHCGATRGPVPGYQGGGGSNNHYETASFYQENSSPSLKCQPSKVTGSSAGKSRKGRPTKPKKVRRRLSDAEKSKENINSYQDKISKSVTSSPALSRKSSNRTNIKSAEEKKSNSNLIYDCDKGYNDRVSEDINDMVEQIQAIQNDISELAGRPISLIDYKH